MGRSVELALKSVPNFNLTFFLGFNSGLAWIQSLYWWFRSQKLETEPKAMNIDEDRLWLSGQQVFYLVVLEATNAQRTQL